MNLTTIRKAVGFGSVHDVPLLPQGFLEMRCCGRYSDFLLPTPTENESMSSSHI